MQASVTLRSDLTIVIALLSTGKAKHKRNDAMKPVRSSVDWKLSFLRKFADFLQRWDWEATGNGGLTRETFLALRHTCLALADCTAYLIDHLGFKFVLLGHLQSDDLESRFGWLRQLSGANYYVYMRQVVESDRNIQTLSLLKFSSISLSEIDDAIQTDVSSATSSNEADTVAVGITECLKLDAQPSSSDENIIFYVGGARL